MGMYVVRRVVSGMVTMLLISLLCFFVVNLPAGDVASEYSMQLQMSSGMSPIHAEAAADQLRQEYGLDRPVLIRYAVWLGRFMQGDFGISLLNYRSASQLITSRLGYTVAFALGSLLFAWSVGVSIGVYSARHQYSIGDNVATVLAFLGQSVPGFLLALALLVLVVVGLRLELPVGLMAERFIGLPFSLAKLGSILWRLWIPIIVGGLPTAAGLLRLMRGSLLDELGREYVETARSKGLPERTVVRRHAFRVAINPLISVLGVQFPVLISGGVITSIVLGLPTLGPLLFSSLVRQDVYVASAILMLMGVLLVIGNIVADVLLAWVDPRIRLE